MAMGETRYIDRRAVGQCAQRHERHVRLVSRKNWRARIVVAVIDLSADRMRRADQTPHLGSTRVGARSNAFESGGEKAQVCVSARQEMWIASDGRL